MRTWPPSLFLLLSVAGVAVVVDSVLRGNATLSLVLVVPVVTGSSLELLGGIALIFLGLLAWGLASAARSTEPEGEPPASSGARPSPEDPASIRSGGVVLLGPIPIFFGGYRPMSRGARWAWVGLGLALVIGVWVVLAALVYFR